MPQQDRPPPCVCVSVCVHLCVCALCDGSDGPLQSVSIWKHSVLVCCFNLRCVGCLNSRVTKKRQDKRIFIHTQRPTRRRTVHTDGFCFPFVVWRTYRWTRVIERGSSALKIDRLKRRGRAAGDETSADKRRGREGDGAARQSSPFYLEAREEARYVAF